MILTSRIRAILEFIILFAYSLSWTDLYRKWVGVEVLGSLEWEERRLR